MLNTFLNHTCHIYDQDRKELTLGNGRVVDLSAIEVDPEIAHEVVTDWALQYDLINPNDNVLVLA